MDIDKYIENQTQKLNDIKSSIDKQIERIKECYSFTKDFLLECEKSGIKLVGIRKSHKKLAGSESFPFDHSDSVFSDKTTTDDNWPAIWGICERFGVYGGCGNGFQAQLKSNADFADGVYELKNGKWNKID